MKLTLDNLKQIGAFTGPPVEKQITWTQGGEEYTAIVYVRRLSYAAAVADVRAATGHKDHIAGRIATAICDETGKPVFTPEDITGESDPDRGALDHGLTMALLTAIGEVNSSGKTKASQRMTKSGTSSSSTELAVEPLQKPSTT